MFIIELSSIGQTTYILYPAGMILHLLCAIAFQIWSKTEFELQINMNERYINCEKFHACRFNITL